MLFFTSFSKSRFANCKKIKEKRKKNKKNNLWFFSQSVNYGIYGIYHAKTKKFIFKTSNINNRKRTKMFVHIRKLEKRIAILGYPVIEIHVKIVKTL